MTTKVYLLSIHRYSAEEVGIRYEKIKSHFVCHDGARLSKRKESILGKLLLHKALEELEVGEYQVNYTANEKPVLVCDKQLYFNISHSADFVALAVSQEEVGCDIQEIRPYNHKVAKRHYCENETRLIENSSDPDGVFIRFWALKESILKFTGKGISGGLSSYDFSPCVGEEAFEAFGCKFYVTQIEDSFFALCHKCKTYEIIRTDI